MMNKFNLPAARLSGDSVALLNVAVTTMVGNTETLAVLPGMVLTKCIG
jgi:hypothetical protein